MRAMRVIPFGLVLTALVFGANSMHPKFEWLETTDKTCAQCHDVGFIRANNTHSKLRPDCLICHGDINAQPTPRHPPDAACLQCHDIPHSPMLLSKSGLNLAGRDTLDWPFDIHAARGVSCTDCHRSENHPAAQTPQRGPSHLRKEVRAQGLGQFLHRPSHILSGAQGGPALHCTDCHDASSHSTWLPATQRHMERLDCQACHIPQVHPSLRTMAAANQPMQLAVPVLASREGDSTQRIGPFHQNVALKHGVVDAGQALRDCAACHSPQSRVSVYTVKSVATRDMDSLVLAHQNSSKQADHATTVGPQYLPDLWAEGPKPGQEYLYGRDRFDWADTFGRSMAALTAIGITGHALLRVWGARQRRRVKSKHSTAGVVPSKNNSRTYMYTLYERFWHWMQAIAVILLLATGLEVHAPEALVFLGFRSSVLVHQALGMILAVNAFLALFYHLASGEIKQYIPLPDGFFSRALQQQRYYLYGIFKGEPHPFAKHPGHKLNPLQQATYFGLLNVLLPVLVATGLLMALHSWSIMDLSFVGGLAKVAMVHTLAAWSMASFLIGHLYLITTGPRPETYLKAMITGWEDAHEDH